MTLAATTLIRPSDLSDAAMSRLPRPRILEPLPRAPWATKFPTVQMGPQRVIGARFRTLGLRHDLRLRRRYATYFRSPLLTLAHWARPRRHHRLVRLHRCIASFSLASGFRFPRFQYSAPCAAMRCAPVLICHFRNDDDGDRVRLALLRLYPSYSPLISYLAPYSLRHHCISYLLVLLPFRALSVIKVKEQGTGHIWFFCFLSFLIFERATKRRRGVSFRNYYTCINTAPCARVKDDDGSVLIATTNCDERKRFAAVKKN